MKKLILIILLGTLVAGTAYSRPQYSILQSFGTKCTSCHVNPNYGGARSYFGWLARKDISLIDPADIGLEGFYEAIGESNQFFDETVTFGLDFRYQNARWAQSSRLEESRVDGQPVKPTLERKFMIMQLMPYLSYQPTEWLRFDGMYNFAYDIHSDMRYKGQQPFYLSATVKPWEDLPSLRVGYFPPAYSIDYDDHTVLVRQAVGPGRSSQLIPADYAELGAQLNYDAIPWLNASFGVFQSKNMEEVMITNDVSAVNPNTLSTATNISFHPEIGDGINCFFGAAHFSNGRLKTDDGIYIANNYFNISSFYFNIGMADKFAIMTEYINSEKQFLRKVNNYLVELNYQVTEPINVFVRYENAKSEMLESGDRYESNQYVFGSHIFLLPYIDLLPEYRIYDRGDVGGYSSQWAFQIHVFY